MTTKKAQTSMGQDPLQEIEEMYTDLIHASQAVTVLVQHIKSRGQDPQLVSALVDTAEVLVDYLDQVDAWISSGKPLHTQMDEVTHDIIDVEKAAYSMAAIMRMHDAAKLIDAG